MGIVGRLSKIAFVDVVPDVYGLTEREKAALNYCLLAGERLNSIYLKQVSPKNPIWLESLQHRDDPEGRELLRYFKLTGGPWDHFNNNEPFLSGAGRRPDGAGFYPADLTEEEWRRWLHSHPHDREAFLSGQTVISRQEQRLTAVPYSIAFQDDLAEAADHLRQAARLLEPSPLRLFLELRADAFLTNDYYESELAWLDTTGIPFEATIGPYEVYVDRKFGLKAAFQAFFGIPDNTSTTLLERLSEVVPTFDLIVADRLGLVPNHSLMRLEVVDDIFRGGEAAFGRQFIAYNLPNDQSIQEIKGSKKVFSRTLMSAKFTRLILPIAERVLAGEHLSDFVFDNRLLFVASHELAHGLGRRARNDVRTQSELALLLKDHHSLIEESKANALGVALLRYFCDTGLITHAQLSAAIATELAAYLQEWRSGFQEAHSAGCLVEYNWLKEHGAVRFDVENSKLHFDADRVVSAMQVLGDELLRLQSQPDYATADRFVRQWSIKPAEIPLILKYLEDLPSEVVAIFQYHRLHEHVQG